MSTSFATKAVEQGDSGKVKNLALGSIDTRRRGQQSMAASVAPGIDLAPMTSRRPGTEGNSRPSPLGSSLLVPPVFHQTLDEVNR